MAENSSGWVNFTLQLLWVRLGTLGIGGWRKYLLKVYLSNVQMSVLSNCITFLYTFKRSCLLPDHQSEHYRVVFYYKEVLFYLQCRFDYLD